jgi:acetyl esterase/lipase
MGSSAGPGTPMNGSDQLTDTLRSHGLGLRPRRCRGSRPTGLPPTEVIVRARTTCCTRLRLAARTREVGQPLVLCKAEGMQHVCLYMTVGPEAAAARELVVRFCRGEACTP